MRVTKVLLFAIFLVAFALPFVNAQIEVHNGTIFHSVINGGNITFAMDFNASGIYWASNQVRFTGFDNGDTIWTQLGARAPIGTTMNITGVYDTNMTLDATVPAPGTDFEIYVFDHGSPVTVTGAASWSYVGGTMFFELNANATVTLSWVPIGIIYTIELDCVYPEVEVNMNHLLIANCTDSVGNQHNTSIVFVVDGVQFKWNNYMSRYEGTVKRTTAQTVTFDTLDSFTDSDNGASTASIIQNTTATWVTGSMSRITQNLLTGDWIGMIIDEYIFTIGVMVFYTTIMAILSVATYNIAGVYATVFVWITGWGIFSGVVHGQAQLIGIFLIALGIGTALTKFVIDRRTS